MEKQAQPSPAQPVCWPAVHRAACAAQGRRQALLAGRLLAAHGFTFDLVGAARDIDQRQTGPDSVQDAGQVLRSPSRQTLSSSLPQRVPAPRPQSPSEQLPVASAYRLTALRPAQAFTSVLTRAVRTLLIAEDAMGLLTIPDVRASRESFGNPVGNGAPC
jgi:hypothetical protein